MIVAEHLAMDELTPDLSVHGVIVFDGACGFCAAVITRLVEVIEDKNIYLCSSRSIKGWQLRNFAHADRELFAFVTRSGVATEVDAYIQLLRLSPRTKVLSKILETIPRSISENAYSLVAHNRGFISRCLGLHAELDELPLSWVENGRDNCDRHVLPHQIRLPLHR
jgi:predicted DCC family thiol-disulfide oxidoreductase YuxK